MHGTALIKEVSKATGLPDDTVENELHRLLENSGIAAGEATMEDLRSVLAEYLQDVLLQAKEQTSGY